MSTDSITAVAPVASSTFEGRSSLETRNNEEKRADEADGTRNAPPAEMVQRETTVDQKEDTAAEQATGPPERPSTEEVAQRINARLAEAQEKGYLRELSFKYETLEGGVLQLKVMDAKTDKVLRTIPHEDQIEFAERLDRFLGLLIDEQA